jgi:hypothetical protein
VSDEVAGDGAERNAHEDAEDQAVAQRAHHLRLHAMQRARRITGAAHAKPLSDDSEQAQISPPDKAMLSSAKQAIINFEESTLRKVRPRVAAAWASASRSRTFAMEWSQSQR